MLTSINPATALELGRVPLDSEAQVEATLAAAVAAQAQWRETSMDARVELLRRLAAALRKNSSTYARLISLEMGKPLAEAYAEIEKSAWSCEVYAETAPKQLADQPANGGRSKVVFDPLGVVLAIMPWNYPFWQVMRFAAPALAAGDGAILKHAANVPQCARALQALFAEAGAPAGLFGVVMVEPQTVSRLIADPRIAAVTLTGSSEVGALVAAQAGGMLKKQVLELGGSDPFIVLADADVAAAAAAAVKARFINAGQSCVNAKRFIVEAPVAAAFTEAFAAGIAALRVGDPLGEVDMGPMARANLRQNLQQQVARSLADGARCVVGGAAIDGAGFYHQPTLLDRVTPEMAAFREETFGPVAAVIEARDAADALALANRSDFGLGASIWSRDLERAEALARRLEAGVVAVNSLVASDPRLPFGGMKRSGYGRELGEFGIREFVNVKTLTLAEA